MLQKRHRLEVEEGYGGHLRYLAVRCHISILAWGMRFLQSRGFYWSPSQPDCARGFVGMPSSQVLGAEKGQPFSGYWWGRGPHWENEMSRESSRLTPVKRKLELKGRA